MSKPKVIIVGAGISGLYLAWLLQQKGLSAHIIEARNRPGGRIFGEHGYDYGPAWFWAQNNKVRHLLNTLDIDSYVQQDEGIGLYQTADGIRQLPRGYTGLSYRVKGGWSAVIHALLDRVGRSNITFESELTSLTLLSEHICLNTSDANLDLRSQHVVLAIPPRLAAQNIQFQPNLNKVFMDELSAVPTWMGSHAKALIRYPKPFWQDVGLSGTALSATGPLMQIHDASLPESNHAALFGFIGLSASERKQRKASLKNDIVEQLIQLFGTHAGELLDLTIYDWSEQAFSAALSDQKPLNYHPQYGLSTATQWQGRLHFCSTESASRFGGYIEGALYAAEHTFTEITKV